MKEYKYTTNVGNYLVIWITGCIRTYIAEVVRSNPLKIKVEETGPYAHLKDGDFIILGKQTVQIQRDVGEDTNVFLEDCQKKGQLPVSGLESLGITDGKLHEILPAAPEE